MRQKRLGFLRQALERVAPENFDMTFYEYRHEDGRETKGLRCLIAEDKELKATGYGFDRRSNSSSFDGPEVFPDRYFMSAEEHIFGISRKEEWFLFSGNSTTSKQEVLERIDRLLRENIPD
jgi:hypothetical protein